MVAILLEIRVQVGDIRVDTRCQEQGHQRQEAALQRNTDEDDDSVRLASWLASNSPFLLNSN